RLGERDCLARLTGDPIPLSSGRQLGFFGARIVCFLGLPETDCGSAGGLLRGLLGRGEFLVHVEVHRGKNSLGEAFLVAVPLVAASQGGGQQEESEKLWPNSESSGYDRLGRQGQILVDSEGI